MLSRSRSGSGFRLYAALVAILLTVPARGQPVYPDIVVNNVTGTSSASGAPAGFGPISGTCSTGGVLGYSITWTGESLAGVPVDGSAVLSARGAGGTFWRIVGISGDVITLDPDWRKAIIPIAPSFPDNLPCYIGGKLSHFDNSIAAYVVCNFGRGWRLSLEWTGVDYITGSFGAGQICFTGLNGYPKATMRGVPGPKGQLPTVLFQFPFGDTSDGMFELIDGWEFRDLVLKNDAGFGTPGIHNALDRTTTLILTLNNVTFDGWDRVITGASATLSGLIVYNCEVKNGTGAGLAFDGNIEDALFISNAVHDNAGHGWVWDRASNTLPVSFTLLYNLFFNNLGDGINISPRPTLATTQATQSAGHSSRLIAHNTVYNSGAPAPPSAQTSGLTASRVDQGYILVSNLSTNNTSYGLEGVNAAGLADFIGVDTNVGQMRFAAGNAYWSNATGVYLLAAAGAGDTLTVDPKFVKPAAPDYNFTIGEGLLNKGWPFAALGIGIGSRSKTGVEPGASQRAGGAGGYSY